MRRRKNVREHQLPPPPHCSLPLPLPLSLCVCVCASVSVSVSFYDVWDTRVLSGVTNRLATMEPLLQHTYVRQPAESPQEAAIRNHRAEQDSAAIVPVRSPTPPPAGEVGGLQQECAEWPPAVGQTVEVYSRRLSVWVPAVVTKVDAHEATVTYKEGSRRGTKQVAVDDPRVMRWSLSAWLEQYRLATYTQALIDEGYGGHPGYLCAVEEDELEHLVQAVGMKRPQAKVFRQAVIDLREPRPEPTRFTQNLLADGGSGSGSSNGSEGYTYESMTDKPNDVIMPVAVTNSLQEKEEPKGGSNMLVAVVVVIVVVCLAIFFGCRSDVVPPALCSAVGLGGGAEGPEPEPDPNPDPGPVRERRHYCLSDDSL
jgi:hypothetical protein